MQALYDELIEFMVLSGKGIVKRAGKINDIGIKKQYLTEEDIKIERGLKDIIAKHHPSHKFYAEEEHDSFPESEDVWIADPISGTKSFIQGLPHYGIVIAYVKDKVTQFGAVYDPSVDELFTAYKGKGAFLNRNSISVSGGFNRIIFNFSNGWKDESSSRETIRNLEPFELVKNENSHAVNLCHVACGRADGVVCLGEDSFPYFAGGLIIQEAGGIFRSKQGNVNIDHRDRFFIGGNVESYQKLQENLSQISY